MQRRFLFHRVEPTCLGMHGTRTLALPAWTSALAPVGSVPASEGSPDSAYLWLCGCDGVFRAFSASLS